MKRWRARNLPASSISAESGPKRLPRFITRRAFTDYHELFGRVDAVSLAVPTVDHAQIGVNLLEHGIDVLVEKTSGNVLGRRAPLDRDGGAVGSYPANWPRRTIQPGCHGCHRSCHITAVFRDPPACGL
jgi:hypothetical protein